MKDQDFYSEFCSFGWGSGFVHTAFSMLVELCLVFLVMVKYFFSFILVWSFKVGTSCP